MTLHAVGGRERLSLVRLDQRRVFRIVTIQAKGRRRFREVIIELLLTAFAGLVRDMAGFASHVERGVAAAFLRDIQSLGVTAKTEVLVLVAGGSLQQLEFVVGLVWIMTLHAVANRGRMDFAFDVGGVVIGVAGEAERLRGCCNELDARDVFGYTNLMTTGTAHRDRRVDVLSFGFVLVTLRALRRVGILIQRYGMDASKQQTRAGEKSPPHNNPHYSGHNLPPTLTWINARRMPQWGHARRPVSPNLKNCAAMT